MKFMAILVAVLMITLGTGCAYLKSNKNDRFNFSGWTLLKKHHVTSDDALYTAFGSITYEVYANTALASHRTDTTGLPLGTTFAIRVHENETTDLPPVLTGFLKKSGRDLQTAQWQITAYDREQRLLPAGQISHDCQQCHLARDDQIILGHY